MNTNTVLTPADDPVIVISRSFAAPRALVYRCYTEPQHMAHFWGPRGTTLSTCRIDLRVGGVWRVVWQFPDGREWGYSSVYLEIAPNERIGYRDAPDDWRFGLDGLPAAEIVSSIGLADDDGGTAVTVTVRFTSVAARDENVRRGFAGMVSGNDRLAEYLAGRDGAERT